MTAARHFPLVASSETPPGAPAARSEVDARARGCTKVLYGYGRVDRDGVGGGVARLWRAPPNNDARARLYRPALPTADSRRGCGTRAALRDHWERGRAGALGEGMRAAQRLEATGGRGELGASGY